MRKGLMPLITILVSPRWRAGRILIPFVVCLSACAWAPEPSFSSGVALTFDDRGSIESWGEAREFLKREGIRATFFVDRPHYLSDRQVQILRNLVADGHEIGSHGHRHRHVTTFMDDTAVDASQYLSEEVLPSLYSFASHGFAVRSFAYPHGRHDVEVDSLILGHVDIIRAVNPHDAFYAIAAQRGVSGAMTLDKEWRRDVIDRHLRQAIEEKSVLVFAGHKIGPHRGYCWSAMQDIATVAVAVRDAGLPFYTMSELAAQCSMAPGTVNLRVRFPARESHVGTPGSVSLVATVTPEESEAIERVVFYRGAIELGEDREPPYELLWEKAPEGIYFLSAKAYTGERMIVSPAIPVEVYGPHGGVPVPIPGVLAAEQFDYGGPGVGYHDADSLNRGGNYRHFEGVDIVADTEAETGYAVGWTKAGEWLSYLIDVTEMGPFKIQTRVASQGEGGQFRVEMNGVDVTGPLQVPCTGGWSNYTLVAKDGIALTQGVQSVRVVMVSEGPDGYVGAFDSISVFLQ